MRAAKVLAAALARARSERGLASSGYRRLTLGELERIGEELGVEREHVRRAAVELDVGSPSGGSLLERFVGGPTQLSRRRTVPFPSEEADHERYVNVIRGRLEEAGRLERTGRSFAWTAQSPTRMVQVELRAGATETTFVVREHLGQHLGGLYGGLVGGLGGGGFGFFTGVVGGALGLVSLSFVLAVLNLGFVLALARTLFRRRVRERSLVLDALLDDLEGAARNEAGRLRVAARARGAEAEREAEEEGAQEAEREAVREAAAGEPRARKVRAPAP